MVNELIVWTFMIVVVLRAKKVFKFILGLKVDSKVKWLLLVSKCVGKKLCSSLSIEDFILIGTSVSKRLSNLFDQVHDFTTVTRRGQIRLEFWTPLELTHVICKLALNWWNSHDDGIITSNYFLKRNNVGQGAVLIFPLHFSFPVRSNESCSQIHALALALLIRIE